MLPTRHVDLLPTLFRGPRTGPPRHCCSSPRPVRLVHRICRLFLKPSACTSRNSALPCKPLVCPPPSTARYEGDLLAAANASWVVGREAAAVYNESAAGRQAGDSVNNAYEFKVQESPASDRLLPLWGGARLHAHQTPPRFPLHWAVLRGLHLTFARHNQLHARSQGVIHRCYYCARRCAWIPTTRQASPCLCLRLLPRETLAWAKGTAGCRHTTFACARQTTPRAQRISRCLILPLCLLAITSPSSWRGGFSPIPNGSRGSVAPAAQAQSSHASRRNRPRWTPILPEEGTSATGTTPFWGQ